MNKISTSLTLALSLVAVNASARTLEDMHCLSALQNGVQWSVETTSDQQDPPHVKGLLSPVVNGKPGKPVLTISGAINDENDAWGGYSVLNENGDTINDLYISSDTGRIVATLGTGSNVKHIDEELYCNIGKKDTWSFEGWAYTSSSIPLNCASAPLPKPEDAEAKADEVAGEFCKVLGRKAVRADEFSLRTNNCVWGGPQYHYASDQLFATADYRCQ